MSDRKDRKVQFWINPTDADKMSAFADEGHRGSLSGLIRNAIALYLWVAPRLLHEGGELQYVTPDDKVHAIVLPALSPAASTGSGRDDANR